TMQVSSSTTIQITTPFGRVFVPPTNQMSGAATVTDANGNRISVDGAGHFTDTIGTVALSIAGNAPNPKVFTYIDSNGHSQTIILNYKAYTVQTAFGCGIGEYALHRYP